MDSIQLPSMATPKKNHTWIAASAILGSFLCQGMIISIESNISNAVEVKSSNLKDIPMTYYGILFGIFKLTVFMCSTLFTKTW